MFFSVEQLKRWRAKMAPQWSQIPCLQVLFWCFFAKRYCFFTKKKVKTIPLLKKRSYFCSSEQLLLLYRGTILIKWFLRGMKRRHCFKNISSLMWRNRVKGISRGLNGQFLSYIIDPLFPLSYCIWSITCPWSVMELVPLVHP